MVHRNTDPPRRQRGSHRPPRSLLRALSQGGEAWRPAARARGLPPGARGAFLVLVLTAVAGPARAASPAWDVPTHVGAEAAGAGGAFRGTPGALENVIAGPAVLALEPRYDIVADGVLAPGDWYGAGASAVDSRTNRVTLGLRYRYAHHPDLALGSGEGPGWRDPDTSEENAATTHAVAAGLAMADPARVFSLGVSGLRWWRASKVGDDALGWRLGGSAAGRPHPTVTLSAGASTPIATSGALGAEDLPWVDGGLRWQPHEAFGLVADALLPLPVEAPEIGAGAEAVAGGVLPLRAGWSRPSGWTRDRLTAGIGFRYAPVEIAYALRIDVRGPSSGEARHAASVRLAF